MCSGCGNVQRPSIRIPRVFNKPTAAAIRELNEKRGTCPSCHKKMATQSDGSWLCRPCGVTRR